MKDLNLPPEVAAQIATAIQLNKPYLLGVEEWVQGVRDGFIEIRLEVRSGRVEKMTKYSGEYWIRKDPDKFTREVLETKDK